MQSAKCSRNTLEPQNKMTTIPAKLYIDHCYLIQQIHSIMESSYSSWAILLAITAVAFYISKTIFKPGRKLPPGPTPWPIIGNLNLLLGTIPHQALHVLAQKYGEIMHLKFGKFPVVVASSPEMAKQFLRVHDLNFASRPALLAGKLTGYNYTNLAWAPYGPYWKQARKIFISEVLSAKRIQSFSHIREEERRTFLSRLRSLSLPGKPILLKAELSHFTLSVISRMVLGNKYFVESDPQAKAVVQLEDFQKMMDELFVVNGVIDIGDWIPWLKFLDLQGYIKRMNAVHKDLDKFLSHVVEDHLQQAATSPATEEKKEDLVDVLLHLCEDPNLEIEMTKECIKGLLQDLLAAGTDSSASTIEWALQELLRNPRTMEKAKEELNRVIGRERRVEEDDCSKLPYLDAVIIESMRLHAIATFLTPHYNTEDCKVAGYDIAKGTMVLVNTWSIGRDPSTYDSPLEFLPERFLGKETDLTGSNFALLPFGSGRRMCAGYNLALKIVRVSLANLLHEFDIKLLPGMRPEDVSMEEEFGLTTHPKEPLRVILEPTFPAHFY